MPDLVPSDMALEDILDVQNMIDLDNYDYPNQAASAMVDEFVHFEHGVEQDPREGRANRAND